MRAGTLISRRERKILFGFLGIGIGGFVLAHYLEIEQLWPAFLLNSFFFLSLALGGIVFVSIHHVSNAAWSTAIRRVAEAVMAYLPIGAILMLVIFFGRHEVYREWVDVTFGAHGHDLFFKNFYLGTTFFFLRMAVILALWVLFAFLLLRESRLQDVDGKLEHTQRSKKYSAIFLVVFAVTITVASFDWLMSVEPLFYSTIYAFYVISGVLLSGTAAITALVILLRRRGFLREVTEDHLHNFGRLIFGFATFWAYIWLCQYLLIYYANLPEETIYYYRRTATPGWNALFLSNLFLNWIIPFVMLLPRSVKRHEGWLLTVCVIVLIGHWVDLYLMIYPIFERPPVIGLVELAFAIGFASLFLQSFIKRIRSVPLLPAHDPYLEESLWHEPEEISRRKIVWSKEGVRALVLSTIAFAITFAVWGMIGALAPQFREMYKLSAIETSIIIAVPVLLGSIGRLPLGILADKFGGRIVFGLLLIFCVIPAFGVSLSDSYQSLLFWGLLLGCAGTSFSVGVAFTSKWFPAEQQGTALGIYGMGNIGQSVAVFGAPAVVAFSGNWRLPFWLFGVAAGLFGLVFLMSARNAPVRAQPKKFHEYLGILKREPLAWALSLFYFLTFGGFVALGIYLPTLLRDTFDLSPTDAGARVAGFVVVATLTRPLGGWLADRYGGAEVLAFVFALIMLLSLGLTSNAMLLFTIGALGTATMLGLGNGAVFKLVPEYFPRETGTVTGLVGAAGGLGGFFPALVLGFIRAETDSYTLGFVFLSAFAFMCLAIHYFVFLRGRGEWREAGSALVS